MAFEIIQKISPVDPLNSATTRAEFLAHVPPHSDPLGPLAELPGKWVGKGFNQIWRPVHGATDRFLELNLTDETLEFSKSIGDIPNRGLLQNDLTLQGIHYLQQSEGQHCRQMDFTLNLGCG